MASIQKSMRMPDKMAIEIQELAQNSGKDFSTIAKELLEEAIKMRRCPGISFTEGVHGRRARISGSGIEVFEIIENYRSIEGDLSRLKAAYHWLSEQQLRAALLYYRFYPEEIDTLIERNISWSKESMLIKHPFLDGKSA